MEGKPGWGDEKGGNKMRKLVKKPAKKDEVGELKREMARLKRESNAKSRGFELQVKNQSEEIQKKEKEIEGLKADLLRKERAIEDLQASKKLHDQREAELKRLREEIEYKNQQWVSKDMEMESYRKVTEERIFQLGAKVKELEGEAGEPSATS
jgi:predicted  nucleic acid-binding Zn-ribbon protein